MPNDVKKEGVLTITDEYGNLIALVYKDPKSRKNVFYSVSEMGMDEIEFLLKQKPKKE